MEQYFDIEQLRQEWGATAPAESANIDWASAEELSRVVARYKTMRRRQVGLAGTTLITGIAILIFSVNGMNDDELSSNRTNQLAVQGSLVTNLSAQLTLTNQPGLDESTVASIMDEAWNELIIEN